jgi:anti-sigma factor RsiW
VNAQMPRSCVVHRAALLDFVDGQPRTPATGSALSHLERCRPCEEDLAGILRTLAALRRLGESVADAEPSAEAWPRLRARAVRTGRRSRVSVANTAGGLVAASLVAAMVVSQAVLPRSRAFTLPSPAVSRIDAFEPRIVPVAGPGLTVYAAADDGHPQAPDGDRINLAGTATQSASGDSQGRWVSRA